MSGVPLLDLKLQYAALRDEIDAAIADVVASQNFILGATVERFESEICRYTGSRHAIGCASGTDALILALAAVGVGQNDEVLTSPFSFFSTASCAYKTGARPVFVDIDSATFNLDPNRVADAIGPRTKALLPVHLFGQCAEMGPLNELACRAGIPVIEDAAQALGATMDLGDGRGDRHAGTLGLAGCYSFFPTKNLGGFGDGGLVVTDDARLAERLRLLRVHGGRQLYHHEYVGWNSRLDALQAAVLAVKLPHLDAWSKARAANADRYDRWLTESGVIARGWVRLPFRGAQRSHIFNQYTLRVDRRDELRTHLSSRGIGNSVYYPVPLHLQDCFSELGYSNGDFPETERACGDVISLPIFPELTGDQQERVVGAIDEFYRS